MKIRTIYIDGFGIWHDRRWSGLSEGVNVFYGPNEAGKTTLMSFIRSVLFGFERRAHPRRYEPRCGGDHGGWLEVSAGQGRTRIERKASRQVRGAVSVRALDSGDPGADSGVAADADRALEDMLGGTTRTLYHNVFAFGLEELEHFRTLEESEVASHISGAGMGVGARRWSQVWKDLEERRSKLFLPRGQNTVLNRALAELEEVREELDKTGEESRDYFRIVDELDQLQAEMQALEEDIRTLDVAIRHYRKVREAEPNRKRRAALLAELEEIEPVEGFPEGGVDRLNLLFDQRRSFESEMERNREEVTRTRAERVELTRQYAPQELIRRSRAVESLRLLLPRRDASDEIVASAAGRRDSARLELERVQARQAALAPPAPLSMLLLGLLVALAASVLEYAGYPAGRWIAGGLAVVCGGWYYSRVRAAGGLDSDLRVLGERLAGAERDLSRAQEDAQKVAMAIERRAGRSDFSHVDLETESLRVTELEEIAERLRTIEERLEYEDRQCERLRGRLEDTGRQIDALLRDGGARSETEFFRRAELFRRITGLRNELRRIPPDEIPLPEGLSISLDAETYEDAVRRHDAAQARLQVARTEAGRLEERITTLSRSEQRSRARLREESVMAEIDEASEKWAVLTLCRALLTDTRQIYETERQPEVLRHASEFFSRMTGGSWARVLSPLDSGILVESPGGDRISPENLSRGTAEQLYLAMRLALVREYSRHVEPLPVVLDDIFVNFDPQRTRRSLEAVAELSRTHQVLLFTCHPHLVRMVEEIVPGAELYQLQ